MNTSFDCIPCFFKQALDAARLAGAKPALQKKILLELAGEIQRFNLKLCPPLMGRILYALVSKRVGKTDPFKEIKQRSNEFALRLYPRLKEKVEQARDRLLASLELAIAGNMLDYGAKAFYLCGELGNEFFARDKIMRRAPRGIFDYPAFRQAQRQARRILYLADNAGEVVFDRILLEEWPDKEIIYAVRDKPIINDALKEDALFCGIQQCARIVSCGCAAPGVVLELCSPRFLKIYQSAELIISKGQGNFEALGEEKRPIFFLFRAKCAVVAKHLGCKMGDIILKQA